LGFYWIGFNSQAYLLTRIKKGLLEVPKAKGNLTGVKKGIILLALRKGGRREVKKGRPFLKALGGKEGLITLLRD